MIGLLRRQQLVAPEGVLSSSGISKSLNVMDGYFAGLAHETTLDLP
jgi:hypothetical protein